MYFATRFSLLETVIETNRRRVTRSGTLPFDRRNATACEQTATFALIIRQLIDLVKQSPIKFAQWLGLESFGCFLKLKLLRLLLQSYFVNVLQLLKLLSVILDDEVITFCSSLSQVSRAKSCMLCRRIAYGHELWVLRPLLLSSS